MMNRFNKETNISVFGDTHLVYVHVGKTAGESIISWFENNDLSFTEAHVAPALPLLQQIVAETLSNCFFVVSVRDPIERFISAFNWDRHNLGLNPEATDASLKQAFAQLRTPDELVDVIRTGEASRISSAHRIISRTHIFFDLDFYLVRSGILHSVPADRICFVPLENLSGGLERFASQYMISQPKNFEVPHTKNNFTDDYEEGTFSKEMKPINRKFLSSFLLNEYRVLWHIKRDFGVPYDYQFPPEVQSQ
ncbi:sulfotransferase family 2 domain-containing protein [Parvularcula lutaonensis]|uniref:Sulfotransferase family 2 domain-containing protein n=1 Tax=Parvularcula lutaonensis TaxID=491923 RepID=A0ABV7MH95_9PROT|nr:sulfotransferase family 2 domain-containing protein [Parvularcula lutaonensis]